ncbi:MAG: carboxymuconolactone decarboxylase family protein [bacterium]|nr:carboxymuconolactone decarboxylase family protein [bacterium]
MSDKKRFERGLEKFNEVYCGDLPAPPPGAMPFFDVMLEQLFGEVWTRSALSQRDRRLVTMGVIAALGEREAWAIQVRSALKNEELNPEQVREMVIHLAQYAGYPRVSGLVSESEKVLQEFADSNS